MLLLLLLRLFGEAMLALAGLVLVLVVVRRAPRSNHRDVRGYYRHTTSRDYALLRWVTGSEAMHTRLSAPPLTAQGALILGELRAGRATRVLEIGCGRGADLVALAVLAPDITFHAVDLMPEHVAATRAAAARAGATNVAAYVGDGRCWRPPAARYDAVFGCESLCHLDTPVGGLRTFLRHLATHCLPQGGGGRLIVLDAFRSATFAHHDHGQARRAMRRAEAAFCIDAMPSRARWARLASAAGLRTVHWRDLTDEALTFWEDARRWAGRVHRWAPARLLAWYTGSAARRRSTGDNLQAARDVALALRDRAAAEYGLLVLEANLGRRCQLVPKK